MPNIKEFRIPGSGSGTTGDQGGGGGGGRAKFDWGRLQLEAGTEAAAVLRSSEHLDVPHFKIEINYPHKVEVSSRTWRQAAAGGNKTLSSKYV